MIIQFSVENFRSIMEPATLSLVASPLKDVRVATEDVIFDIDGMDVGATVIPTTLATMTAWNGPLAG